MLLHRETGLPSPAHFSLPGTQDTDPRDFQGTVSMERGVWNGGHKAARMGPWPGTNAQAAVNGNYVGQNTNTWQEALSSVQDLGNKASVSRLNPTSDLRSPSGVQAYRPGSLHGTVSRGQHPAVSLPNSAVPAGQGAHQHLQETRPADPGFSNHVAQDGGVTDSNNDLPCKIQSVMSMSGEAAMAGLFDFKMPNVAPVSLKADVRTGVERAESTIKSDITDTLSSIKISMLPPEEAWLFFHGELSDVQKEEKPQSELSAGEGVKKEESQVEEEQTETQVNVAEPGGVTEEEESVDSSFGRQENDESKEPMESSMAGDRSPATELNGALVHTPETSKDELPVGKEAADECTESKSVVDSTQDAVNGTEREDAGSCAEQEDRRTDPPECSSVGSLPDIDPFGLLVVSPASNISGVENDDAYSESEELNAAAAVLEQLLRESVSEGAETAQRKLKQGKTKRLKKGELVHGMRNMLSASGPGEAQAKIAGGAGDARQMAVKEKDHSLGYRLQSRSSPFKGAPHGVETKKSARQGKGTRNVTLRDEQPGRQRQKSHKGTQGGSCSKNLVEKDSCYKAMSHSKATVSTSTCISFLEYKRRHMLNHKK
ncbi:hypothetical protein AAFF_G00261840 [Aldrovandia affinis]|uniref:Uncharacterized protein n=1 Tax=Aldrovandia affinis TaxID=143900 RepID=A0AAD7RBZ3_9TELE|nr:hypothetical protein AAFF_G00261840 [Aldrovandia affinis]